MKLLVHLIAIAFLQEMVQVLWYLWQNPTRRISIGEGNRFISGTEIILGSIVVIYLFIQVVTIIKSGARNARRTKNTNTCTEH